MLAAPKPIMQHKIETYSILTPRCQITIRFEVFSSNGCQAEVNRNDLLPLQHP